jgi:hypothetical protein
MPDIRIFIDHSIIIAMQKMLGVIRICLLLFCVQTMQAQVFAPADGSKKEEAMEYFKGDLTGFQVSPSGKGVAYLRYEDGQWALFWDNINGGREARVSKSEQTNVVDFRWVGDDAIVYSTGEGSIGTELHRFETFNKLNSRLTSTPVWVKFLDSHHYNNGTSVVIRKQGEAGSDKVYSIKPGMRELLHVASGTGVNWIEDIGNGGIFSIQKTEGGYRFVNSMNDAGEKLGEIRGLCSIQGLALAGKSKSSIYALSDLNRNYSALVQMDMVSASETAVILEQKGASITKVLFSFKDGKPLVAWYEGVSSGYQLVDESFGALLSEMTEKLPSDYGLDIVHSDASGNVWILSTLQGDGVRAYYHYNVANKTLKAFRNYNAIIPIQPSTDLVALESGDALLVRYYVPSDLSGKSAGVLLFRDAPWKGQGTGAMDALIQRLVREGFVVAEVDLGFSEASRKKLLHSGYDQCVDRFLPQLPMILKNMRDNYQFGSPLISLIGQGIGCRAVQRISGSNMHEIKRCVFIDAAPESEGYLSVQFPMELSTRDFVLGYQDVKQTISVPYVARDPLFVYSSTSGVYYKANIDAAIKKFSDEGKSPESFVVGAGFGEHFSSVVVDKVGYKLIQYLR